MKKSTNESITNNINDDLSNKYENYITKKISSGSYGEGYLFYSNNNPVNDSKQERQHVYFFNTLEVSNLKIILSMTSKNIQEFLNKYLNLGGLISSMINHIMKSEENKINLKGTKIENYNGTIKDTIKTIINCYKQSTFKVFLGLSAKGIFEGFLNLFKSDLNDYRNNFLMRTRIPRALYGNYSSIRRYDKIDSQILDLVKNKKLKIHDNFHPKSLKLLKCERFFDDKGREFYFIMTTKNLIIYSKSTEACIDILEYIFIDKCLVLEDLIIYIKFNQNIDEVKFFLI